MKFHKKYILLLVIMMYMTANIVAMENDKSDKYANVEKIETIKIDVIGKIMPISYKIMINNNAYTLNGYVIEDNKYFKIRDLAIVFRKSNTPFHVSYDIKNKSIVMKTNQIYNETKLLTNNVKDLNVKENKNKIVVDNIQYDQIKSYIIDNYSYFSIDDMIEILKLDVR